MFALCDELLIKLFDHGVMLNRAHHGHRQHGADGRPAPGDGAEHLMHALPFGNGSDFLL